MMVSITYGYIWADSFDKPGLINPHNGVPEDKTDEIIRFLKNNYLDRWKILSPKMHLHLMKECPIYKADCERAEVMRSKKNTDWMD